MIFSSLSQLKVRFKKLQRFIDYTLMAPTGSKFYYLRNVLHNYPDEKCLAILRNLVDAMGKESVTLIDDVVLPDFNVPWQIMQLDLTMMIALASMERTKEQWYHLLDSAGLKILKIDTYIVSLQHCIITAAPK